MQKPTGRPPKPEGTRYVKRTFTCPPELWRRVKAAIPPRERSPLIQEALRQEVERREGEGEETDRQGDSAPAE